MVSFSGILKYLIYIFIAGWMFFLGIMVGRGNSPVTFDTQKFQDRLQTIAKEFGEKKEEPKKIDLSFYDELEQTLPEERASVKSPSKISPGKESELARQEVSVKTSMKKQTYNPKIAVAKTKPADAKKEPEKIALVIKEAEKTVTMATEPAVPKPEEVVQSPSGRYTIQVAAYKDFKDAVTQMAILEKKGFSSYRQKTDQNGITWYRVRVGSFETYEDAKKFKVGLDRVNINSMITKKEANENIKE